VTGKKEARSRLQFFDLEEQLQEFEFSLDSEQAVRWPNRGLYTTFPQLSQGLDGFRNYLYLFAGGSRMGKSTFLLQLAYDLLRLREDCRVLFLSLDQPVRDLHLRMVAMAGQCHLDFLSNPTVEGEEKYLKKKRKGLKLVSRLKDRLHLVDESHGAMDMDEIRLMVTELREGFDGPLFVVVDPIFKIRSHLTLQQTSLDERTGFLAAELKTLAMQKKVGILASTRLQRGAGARRPELRDLEEQSSLLYEAAAVCLLYCDASNDGNTPFLEWEWGTDDLMVPIFELDVVKNKMGPAVGRLFYRFYQSYSRFKECSELEVDNFRRMLENLERHSGEDESKEPNLLRIEDVSAALPDPPSGGKS
jgi:replicative DNA helicase